MEFRRSQNDRIGRSTVEDGADLDEFAFDTGTKFVRWAPWGNERTDDDVWVVTKRSFQYTVSWIRDRDDVPTLEDHRIYHLLSRETFASTTVPESELKRGDWMPLAEVDDGD